MTLYESVKSNVTTLQAAERYGLKVSHGGMCKCPFHDDKNPSMKVDQRFHCFGCQADGDVINFTSRLFHLSPKEAAIKLAADFGIEYDATQAVPSVPKRPEITEKEIFLHKASFCYQELASYRNLLVQWQQQYAPMTPDDELHPRFLEAIRNLEMVEYQLDVLLSGSDAEKSQIIDDYLQEHNEKMEEISMEPIVNIPVYRQSVDYARSTGEMEDFRESHRANIACKRDIEKTIAEHFDGFHLDQKAVTDIMERYGAERVSLVLAATVQVKSWDGRFSRSNKDWAFSFDFPQATNEFGYDRRDEYAVTTHPAILDGFINQVRVKIKALEYLAEKDNPIEAAKAVTPEKPAKKKSFSMER